MQLDLAHWIRRAGVPYIMHMPMERTTLMLPTEVKRAAREVGERLGVSASEALRRAMLDFREQIVGPSPKRRRERVAALDKLTRLSEGRNPAREVRDIKKDRAWR